MLPGFPAAIAADGKPVSGDGAIPIRLISSRISIFARYGHYIGKT